MTRKREISAEEALQRLKDGNERFLVGGVRVPVPPRETLTELARGQHPFTTILGCSDSRVPPARLAQAVERNVRWTVSTIIESPEGQARVAEGRVKYVGAIYEIQTGRVRFLEASRPASHTPRPAKTRSQGRTPRVRNAG